MYVCLTPQPANQPLPTYNKRRSTSTNASQSHNSLLLRPSPTYFRADKLARVRDDDFPSSFSAAREFGWSGQRREQFLVGSGGGEVVTIWWGGRQNGKYFSLNSYFLFIFINITNLKLLDAHKSQCRWNDWAMAKGKVGGWLWPKVATEK